MPRRMQRGSRSRSRMTDFAEIGVTRAAASWSASDATLHEILTTSQPKATCIRRSSYTNINAEARDEHEHAWREEEKRGGYGAYITRTPPSPMMAMTAKSANNKQASDRPNKRATHTACVVSSVEKNVIHAILRLNWLCEFRTAHVRKNDFYVLYPRSASP